MALFLTFEGIDGCGKSTQLLLLQNCFESAGFTVVATREPGGTALAETIRNYLLHSPEALVPQAELALFGAARAQHVAEIIRPALAAGSVVLSDRFADSSLAYQGGGLGLDSSFIEAMNRFVTGGLMPDLTILLDLDPEAGRSRRAAVPGGDDRIEARGAGFQAAVRAAYLRLAESEPQRFLAVDASLPQAPIHDLIARHLRQNFAEFSSL